MKHPRVAILAMAAVHLLLFFLLLLWWDQVGSSWTDYSRIAVFASQGVLLGVWAALGGKPTPWRVIAVTIGAAAWGWYIGLHTVGPIATATAVLADEMFLVTGILLPARFMGLRLDKAESGSEGHPGRLRFSVGQALLWTTALSVFMGASAYLKDSFAMYFSKREIRWPASWLAIGLFAMWLVCGSVPSDIKQRHERIIWVVMQCWMLLAIILVGSEWIRRVNEWLPPWDCAYMLSCEAAVTAASLLVVGLAGYRLVWHWPFRRSQL